MAEVLKKLEARVSALEAENQQSKKEAAAARAEAQALRQKIDARKPAVPAPAAVPANTVLAAPASTKPYEVKSPSAPVGPAWGGLYVGAAGGLGLLHGNEAFSEISNSSTSLLQTSFASVDTSTGAGTGSFTGRNPGAMISLFLGYNSMLSSNWLIGGQLEGTLANTRVSLNGSESVTGATTSVTTPPGGAAGTSIATTTSTVSGAGDTLDNQWLLSALARTGFLVDPSDLVYVIGGYTYGRFEYGRLTAAGTAESTGFGMNGGTIGVGWERQIIGGWNLRAEYRYTRFAGRTVNLAESGGSTQTSTGTLFANTQNLSDVSHFSDVDMHSVWLGVSHSFGP